LQGRGGEGEKSWAKKRKRKEKKMNLIAMPANYNVMVYLKITAT